MNKTKNAAYLHFPKTASSWMNKVLAPVTLTKFQRHAIPADIKKYQNVFCFIRNPWDWHVSFYKFISNGGELYYSPIKRAALTLSLPKNINFTNFVKLLCDPSNEFRDTLAANIVAEKKIFSNSSPHIEQWQHSNTGLYSSLINYYTMPASYVGKYENLKDDLIYMTKTAGDFTNEILDNILNMPPRNVTVCKEDYRNYYTDETIEIVHSTSKNIIKKYNYEF